MFPRVMTLREIFHSPPDGVAGDWLYLPGEYNAWTLDTEAYFPPIDPESGEPVLDPGHASRAYRETLDLQTIEDVVQVADRLAGRPDDATRFETLIYYVRFDAFPSQIGASDPPPWEETRRRLDREFYDGLGAEDASRPCRTAACSHGSVRLSVFCRVHHFESICRRPCPFND